ncbi:MAG: hypothetical protein K8H88_25785 [Sandaracinaceae bacterium]|nr:hypothetical protein [Sandaracinaceae bacterium]
MRPFFVLAALHAVLVLPAWILVYMSTAHRNRAPIRATACDHTLSGLAYAGTSPVQCSRRFP